MHGEWVRKSSGGVTAIFVHGFMSSGEKCWRNENGVFWPDLLRDEPGMSAIGIYVFTYQTGVFSGSYRVSDIVDALSEHMELDEVFDSNRLIFVCHSMGGIVVRKFIVEKAVDLIKSNKNVDLFLIASPSLGAQYADWLSPIGKFLGNRQADILRFVRNNQWLSDLDKEFTNLKESQSLKIRGRELVEDKFLYFKKIFGKQLVEPFSGTKYFGRAFRVAGSDHFSIAKPANKMATQHRILCRWILNVGVSESNRSLQPETPTHTKTSSEESGLPDASMFAPKALSPASAAEILSKIGLEQVKGLDDALLISTLHSIPGNLSEAPYLLVLLKNTLENSSLIPGRKARELLQLARRLDRDFAPAGAEEWREGYERVRFIIEPILEKLPTQRECYKKILSTSPGIYVPFLISRYASNPWKTDDEDQNAFTRRRFIRENIVNIVFYHSLGKECFSILDLEARQYTDEIEFDLESNMELIDEIKSALGADFVAWYQSFRGKPYNTEMQALEERWQRERDQKKEELERVRGEYYAYHRKYREPPTPKQSLLLIKKIDDISTALEETKAMPFFSESNRLIDLAKHLLKPYFPDAAFRMHEVQQNGPGPYARNEVLDGLKEVRQILEIEAARGDV